MIAVLFFQMIIIVLYIFLSTGTDKYPHTFSFIRQNYYLISSIFVLFMCICVGLYILIW